MKKSQFLAFCKNVEGKEFFDKNGNPVPKYILYWSGYSSEDLIFYRTQFDWEYRK